MSTVHFQLTFKVLECYIMDSSVRHANTIFFIKGFSVTYDEFFIVRIYFVFATLKVRW